MRDKNEESVEELAEALESRLTRKTEADGLEEIELDDFRREWFSGEDISESFWENEPSEEESYEEETFGQETRISHREKESVGKKARRNRFEEKEPEREAHRNRFEEKELEREARRNRFEEKEPERESRRNRFEEKEPEKEARRNRFEEKEPEKEARRSRFNENDLEEEGYSNRWKRKESEAEFPEDEWEEDDIAPMKPWMMTAVLTGLIVLAAIICAVLWHFTHLEKEEGDGNAQSSASVSVESSETNPAGTEESGPEVTLPPEETAPTPSPAVSPTPAAPQVTVQPETQASASIKEPVSGTTAMEFTQSNADVTPKDVVNLRSEPSTVNADNIVVQAKNGEVLSRTGVNEATGWTRIEYNGDILYAVSQYLTTDLNYKPPVQAANPNRVNTIDGRIILFTDCSDNITPKEYVNLRTEPSTSQGEATVRCQVSNGEVVHRTGYSPDAGWSRVEYNGEILYVVSSYMYTVE